MTDLGHRKIPLDKPSQEENDGRSKKKKVEEVPQAIMDDLMEEKASENSDKKNKNKEAEANKECNTKPIVSYRESLMNFNGVAHGGYPMEEAELFNDDQDMNWKLLEPSKEVKKLMEIYPIIPISQEEFNEWCKLWNYALVLTVLGKKFNMYRLKKWPSELWGFSSFELIDLPNNYFSVRFQETENWKHQYRKVLYEGPWVVKQNCVLVQRWLPYFNPYKNPLG